jgi:hypothetical protein
LYRPEFKFLKIAIATEIGLNATAEEPSLNPLPLSLKPRPSGPAPGRHHRVLFLARWVFRGSGDQQSTVKVQLRRRVWAGLIKGQKLDRNLSAGVLDAFFCSFSLHAQRKRTKRKGARAALASLRFSKRPDPCELGPRYAALRQRKGLIGRFCDARARRDGPASRCFAAVSWSMGLSISPAAGRP